jgi:hypothetical protein
MDQPTEPIATANRGLMLGAERDHLWRGLGCAQIERSVRTLAVVMVDVLAQDALELTTADDEQPVEALLAQRADEALGVRIGVRGLDGRADDPDAVGPEDLVEAALNFASRSWTRKRGERSRALTSITTFRACCVIHPPFGFSLQPASQTRRLSSSMKNST